MAEVNFDSTETVLGIEEIMEIIPHRYPFLLVDRITEIEPGKRIVGYKNLSMNEEFYQGHFPGKPVMPGVLQVEAMAQVGAVLMLSQEENKGKIPFFMSVNNCKFRKPVLPGDRLYMEIEVTKLRGKTGQVAAKGYVDGKVVVQADLMFAIADA